MKTLSCLCFAVLTGFTVPAGFASEKTIPAPSPTANVSLAGRYKGNWQNGTDGGQLKLFLKQEGSDWKAESSFTFQDADVPATVRSVKVTGKAIELVLQWEIQGGTGESRLTGELNGDKLDGIFESKTGSDTSNGTWSVTRS